MIGAAAASAEPDDDAAEASADKAQYTLLHPTPPGSMREMDIDRPDTTDGPRTIDAGHLQIEGGVFDYSYDHDRLGALSVRQQGWSFGELNFRLGVLNDLELNLIVLPYVQQAEIDQNGGRIAQTIRGSGFGDLTVGGSLNLWGNDSGDATWATALSIKPFVTLPTAGRNLGVGHAKLTVELPFLVNLPGGFGLGLQVAGTVERTAEDTQYVGGYQASAVIDHTLVGDLDGYAEYSVHGTVERHEQPDQTLGLGLVYTATERIKLDTGVDLALDRSAEDIEWLGGISFLF